MSPNVEKSEILHIWHVCDVENFAIYEKNMHFFATIYALSCGEKVSPKVNLWRKNDKVSWCTTNCVRILPASPFQTPWMLVDAAFGSAQIARAGARGLGVALCSLCNFSNTFLVTCMKSNKLRLFTTSWSSWSPPSLTCSSNLQPFVFQRPQSLLLSSHFLAEPFLAGNLIHSLQDHFTDGR